jgi:glycerol-3-phosphate acyltransferase PlsY
MLFSILVLMVPIGYLSGSIPTGYWLAKWLKGIDIRQHGSGSTGATNVWRCVGKLPGISVFIIDLLKGFLPVYLTVCLTNSLPPLADPYSIMPVLTSLAALIGHSKSIFLDFQGGKSAATGLGTLLALKPIVSLETFVTWILMLWLTKIVSLSSIVAVASCGLYMFLAKAPAIFVLYCILGFIYVTYRHKANIERLLNGTEPRLGQKKT